MSENLNRRQRLRRSIWRHGSSWEDTVYDWLYAKAPKWLRRDWVFAALTPHDSQGWAAKPLCRLLAHWAIEDHCGMADHDFCLFCGASIPNGAAEERSARLERVAARKVAADYAGPYTEETE
jgi:hypothetical protein